MGSLNKKLIALNTILLFVVGSSFAASNVQAETDKDLQEVQQERAEVQEKIEQAEKDIENADAELTELSEQIARANEAINDNENMIVETQNNIENTHVEIDALKEEIAIEEEKMQKRFEVLKERASAYQKSGGNLSYLEVILGSSSFGEFIDRVALVSKIMEADSDLHAQIDEGKQILEEKQESVQEKLDELNELKLELEGMQAQLVEQKEQNEALKEGLTQEMKDAIAAKSDLQMEERSLSSREASIESSLASGQPEINTLSKESSKSSQPSSNSISPVSASGDVNALISAGNRYLGNSVYVFGGGRSAYDIANGRFDCSGFVSWAFSQIGVNVGASTSALSVTGTKVSASDMRPGDLVFFNTYKTNGHVGIYVGGNQFIGSQSSTGVAYASMNSSYWSSKFSGHVRRVIN
ncbi:peptidase [Aquibacillus halophilus]|uniref:Peptidase n=2 Tax=Aquibacillus halophilus TaxID=930132 RepID=A0A6A8D8K6_9BACI|nr:peptidase [Aquibacillus halophilus]